MATKRRNLFLYLTLACFFGLVAIFVVDGYLGVYDTVYVTAGEYEQEIEPDFWLRQDMTWSTGVNWGEKAFFGYEVDNRQFSRYTTDVSVSVWRGGEKVGDIVSQQLSIAAFDKGRLEWVVDTTELISAPPEQGYQYSVIINRGEIERKIIMYINPTPYPPKPVPTPPR